MQFPFINQLLLYLVLCTQTKLFQRKNIQIQRKTIYNQNINVAS